jgi:hypothetical protein
MSQQTSNRYRVIPIALAQHSFPVDENLAPGRLSKVIHIHHRALVQYTGPSREPLGRRLDLMH